MIDSFWELLVAWLSEPQVQLVLGVAVGIFLFTLILLYLLRRPIDSIPAFANPNGDVAIARKALHDLIEHRCTAFKSVGHAKADVREKSGKLRALVEIRVRPEVRLEDLSEQIQNEITVLLKDNLGLKNVGDVDVIITGVHRD